MDVLEARQRVLLRQLLDKESLERVLAPLRPPTSRDLESDALDAVLESLFIEIAAIAWAVTRAPQLIERRDWARVLLGALDAFT